MLNLLKLKTEFGKQWSLSIVNMENVLKANISLSRTFSEQKFPMLKSCWILKQYKARLTEPLQLPVVTNKLKVNWIFTSRNDRIHFLSISSFIMHPGISLAIAGGFQPTFTCSKLTIETLEQCVKYIQS